MVTQESREEFAAVLCGEKASVEEAAGAAVIGYRAPTFSIVRETLWSLDVLRAVGFRYDSSIFPIVHDRYGIPDAPRFPHRRPLGNGAATIVEFPLSTVSGMRWRLPVGGGGYFRLLPYPVTAWAIRQLNRREKQPAIVYLHPWEFDPGQPRLPVGRVVQFRHSVNTDTTEAKLRRVIHKFRFAPVRAVIAELWPIAV